MARYRKIDWKNLEKIRKSRSESQEVFWSRFGISQSGGSRYESGREIPAPTAILLALWLTGAVDDEALDKARKAALTG
jgi:DNA-binding transcriptional regulator YiaG